MLLRSRELRSLCWLSPGNGGVKTAEQTDDFVIEPAIVLAGTSYMAPYNVMVTCFVVTYPFNFLHDFS